jgi:hypothetical protein
MAGHREKRPCACRCNCSSGSDDNVSNKTDVSAHILGSAHNSIDLWVSTPNKTKWFFVEKEMMEGNERTGTD